LYFEFKQQQKNTFPGGAHFAAVDIDVRALARTLSAAAAAT